jgi:drug/metabolite transporter (DMT)-like permease
MSVAFALLAAFSNAVNLITQRVSSGAGPSGSVMRLAWYLIRQPLWLLGLAAAIAGFVFQAIALDHGELSVVQPLLITEIVFVLIMRRAWLRQHVRAAAWASAALTCASLAVFIAAAEPRGGHPTPTSKAWVATIALFGGASAVMTVLAARGSPAYRAALYATASAVVAALMATFIKTVVTSLTSDGVTTVLTSWPVYALVASGIASALLVQAALHVGPLTISQPLMVVVGPIVSIWLSVWLFGEYFTDSPAVLATAACSFVALIIGVVLLTRTAPEQDIRADDPSPTGSPAPSHAA